MNFLLLIQFCIYMMMMMMMSNNIEFINIVFGCGDEFGRDWRQPLSLPSPPNGGCCSVIETLSSLVYIVLCLTRYSYLHIYVFVFV